MLRLEYMFTCLVMRQELNMLQFIKNFFKKKQEEKPQETYYPIDEYNQIRDRYKNEQHEKAMKAPINEDRIRKAGW